MVSRLHMTHAPLHYTSKPCRVPFDNIASQRIARKSQKIDEQSRKITTEVPNDNKKSGMISNVPIDSPKESRRITASLLTYLVTYLLTYFLPSFLTYLLTLLYFVKRWSLIWRCFFPVSIFNYWTSGKGTRNRMLFNPCCLELNYLAYEGWWRIERQDDSSKGNANRTTIDRV